MSGPYLTVQSYEVRREPGRDVVLAVFVHHGQVFNLMFEAGTALALAGELEQAYQDSMEPGARSMEETP
jgi:hypothetical protein